MNVKIIAGKWAAKHGLPDMLELPDGAGIADAVAALPIAAGEIGVVSLNGKAAPRAAALSDGDELEVFPVIVDG